MHLNILFAFTFLLYQWLYLVCRRIFLLNQLAFLSDLESMPNNRSLR